MYLPQAQVVGVYISARGLPLFVYAFSFAFAFRRSAQYRFIRRDTSARAAADIDRARFDTLATVRRMVRRVFGSFSSGNARSMAMISARSSLMADSAPRWASSFSFSAVKRVRGFGIVRLLLKKTVSLRHSMAR
ncbi:MAG TPA: hypothetical protein VEU08_12295 [Vicinamibacterales bacterium]|nr:hypothetical protein [Vicinamibacterales bacterium]